MMTVSKLIKELRKVEKTNPRAPVVVDWKSVEGCDVRTHTSITEVKHMVINWDYDGTQNFENKDGSEPIKNVVTLMGDYNR